MRQPTGNSVMSHRVTHWHEDTGVCVSCLPCPPPGDTGDAPAPQNTHPRMETRTWGDAWTCLSLCQAGNSCHSWHFPVHRAPPDPGRTLAALPASPTSQPRLPSPSTHCGLRQHGGSRLGTPQDEPPPHSPSFAPQKWGRGTREATPCDCQHRHLARRKLHLHLQPRFKPHV